MLGLVKAYFRKRRMDKCRVENKERICNKLHITLKNIPSKIKYRLIIINNNFIYLQYMDINDVWMYINLSTMLPEFEIKDYTVNNLFKSVDRNVIHDYLMNNSNIGHILDKNMNIDDIEL